MRLRVRNDKGKVLHETHKTEPEITALEQSMLEENMFRYNDKILEVFYWERDTEGITIVGEET